MQPDAKEIVELLGLAPLEREGGYYASTYVSETSSAIYYLIDRGSFSHLHRLPSDEVYHFYLGDPVEMLELLPDGTSRTTVLGSDVLCGQRPQHVVRAGTWQGSKLASGGAWALLGTTMSPGYTDEGYEHGDRATLAALYPERAAEITALTNEL